MLAKSLTLAYIVGCSELWKQTVQTSGRQPEITFGDVQNTNSDKTHPFSIKNLKGPIVKVTKIFLQLIVIILATAGHHVLALTGGGGQVIKANHLTCQKNAIKLLITGACLVYEQLLQDKFKVPGSFQADAFPSAN